MNIKNALYKPITRRTMLKMLTLSSLGALIGSYPVLIERFMLEVNHYRIPLPNLPKAFDGLRIVQLTDTHIGHLNPAWFLQSAIDIANHLPADIIVFTGDAVETHAPDDKFDIIWQMLGTLQAPMGVYSIFGNHDHWANLDKSIYYAGKNTIVLRHQAVRLERDGQYLWLGGLGDLWNDDLGAEACFANSNTNDCRIALAHNPDTADEHIQIPIDLYICGHSHGGQVNVPGLRELALPINNLNYLHGLAQSKNSQVFTSRGIGCSGFPIRFNAPPEIAMLELRCG
jgi:predicted MPP superfamily phosphohydrolase